MNRYQGLINICHGVDPDRVLEIGTWNGDRAIQLCAKGAEYFGFDLFEDATAETDEEEKNVKAHNSWESVKTKLNAAGVVNVLRKGNTRKTLPDFVRAYQGKPFDFVFIDGGHSVETIESDWREVKKLVVPGSVVVFDDYYVDYPDTDQWGCNRVVEGLDHFLSESADNVMGGGKVKLAVVCI